jgi:hypothetical protein
LLTRLAFARPEAGQATSVATPLDGCPPPDPEALIVGDISIPHVWRSARVAALDAPEVHDGIADKLAARGVELVVLPLEASDRAKALVKLAAMINRRAS